MTGYMLQHVPPCHAMFLLCAPITIVWLWTFLFIFYFMSMNLHSSFLVSIPAVMLQFAQRGLVQLVLVIITNFLFCLLLMCLCNSSYVYPTWWHTMKKLLMHNTDSEIENLRLGWWDENKCYILSNFYSLGKKTISYVCFYVVIRHLFHNILRHFFHNILYLVDIAGETFWSLIGCEKDCGEEWGRDWVV